MKALYNIITLYYTTTILIYTTYEMTVERKARKLYKNKRGSDLLSEIARKKKRKEAEEVQSYKRLSDADYLNILNNQQKACRSKNCSKCFLSHFVKKCGEIDYNNALLSFKEIR